MKISMKHAKVLFAATLLGASAASQAAFVTIDNVGPAADTIEIVSGNDFKSALAGLGVTTYTLGASLGVDMEGSVSFYYYGKEGGYRNDFMWFSTGFTPETQNYFGAPISLGAFDVGPGLFDFGFCAYSSPSTLVGCSNNAQNDGLGMSSFQSIAMSVSGDTAWLFWDDSGLGPDDNHDDMIIKAVFSTTRVPEPGSLALFGLGLLGLAAGTGRKKALKA